MSTRDDAALIAAGRHAGIEITKIGMVSEGQRIEIW